MKTLHVILTLILAAMALTIALYGAFIYLKPATTTAPTDQPALPITTPNENPTIQPNTSPTTPPTPTPTTSPTTTTFASTSTPTSIAIKDDTGATITIPLPVHRIIALDTAHVEILCALGAQNMIVGRGSYCNFPLSINDVTNLGSYVNPNVETAIELQPDVILATTTCDGLSQLQNAGIPVVIQNLANNSVLVPAIHFLGQLVNSQDNATTLVNWINHYTTIVTSRIAPLSANQLPTFYAEQAIEWQTPGSQHVVGQLIVAAGGINIINSSSANAIVVSPESILEQNPQYIFKLTVSTDTADATFYQTAINSINTRTGFSEITAVKSGNVYTYDYTLVQGLRYPVGLLYFAKSMHPDLFTDIDPATILPGMIEQFFGIDFPGVYLYP